MALKLEDFDLVKIDAVSNIKSPAVETLYDITVDGDHTFFVKLPNSDTSILTHNCDGNHITAMLIGWFKKFAPNLFNEGRICKLVTPLIIVEDQKGKILQYFFDVPAFKQWEAKNPNPKGKIRYLKGLGSWERSQLIELIDKNGLDKFIVEYHIDKEGDVYIDDWLGPDAEKRKKYLRVYDFDIDRV